MANKMKVSAEQWIDAAREALIEEGLGGVKVDRLAKSLGVTRGGFYHNFKSQKELLSTLLMHWAERNELIPDKIVASTPLEALRALEQLAVYIIQEQDFSPAFELAIREWSRIDPSVKQVVESIDVKRIRRLTNLFAALGCDEDEAPIRARVWYFHQLGFYSLGYHERQSTQGRLEFSSIYLRILCGKRFIEAAAEDMQKWA